MSYKELKQHGTVDFPIELYHIDRNHPEYEMAHHWHNSIEIIRIINGSLNLNLNNREIYAQKGDIIMVNPEVVHGGIPFDCVYECIVFNIDLLRNTDKNCISFIEDICSKNIVINDFFKNNSTEISEIADSLFDAMNKNLSSFLILSRLYDLFGIILEKRYYKYITDLSNGGDKQNAKLKKVLSFIENSYASPLTLDELAKEAGMSRKYFCHFFKRMTQKTPINYLNTYRIEHAARKLIATDNSITEIAYECGFNDLSYFIKTFKSVKGVSPKTFRTMSD